MCWELDNLQGVGVFCSLTWRFVRLPGGLFGGRYWDRTSDLCRVKAALSR